MYDIDSLHLIEGAEQKMPPIIESRNIVSIRIFIAGIGDGTAESRQ